MSPLPSVTFRSELDPVVRKELDQLDSELTAYLLQEHDDDGHHTTITARSLTVTGPITVIGGPVTVDGVPLLAAVTAMQARLAGLEVAVAALQQTVDRFTEREG